MAKRTEQRLANYRRKRRFEDTPEPARTRREKISRAAKNTATVAPHFVIHLHHASHRHFDLRLQVGGTLRSWAVPKGPSRDPAVKRLAVEVEDHPLSYASFEGSIPKGHYGAGTVAIWDEGTWSSDEPVRQQLEKGHLHFTLHGSRLHGEWSLIRTSMKAAKPQWLLIKADDAFTKPDDIADDTPLSEWREEAPRKTATKTLGKRSPDIKRSAKSKMFPDDFGFQLARLHENPPNGDDWLHEVKYDGYRMLARRDGETPRLSSRNDLDWTARLPHIVHAILDLDCHTCVLDGELVVFDEHGHTRFDLLQQQFSHEIADATRYAVFDLLWLDGEDQRTLPLHERKAALSRLLKDVVLKQADGALVLSGFIKGDGALAYQRACEAKLEGILSKQIDAPYRAGRGDDWRKAKCVDSEEFLIVGFNRGQGARSELGALLLAEPVGDGWRYVGRVGTGFNDALLADLQKKLKPAKTAPALRDAPGAKQLRGAKPVWVKPHYVAEIEFRGRTGDDLLRQASFKGLRPDKSPDDLRDNDRGINDAGDKSVATRAKNAKPKDKPKAKSRDKSDGVTLTHPDRVLIDEPRVTKCSLANFYTSIAGHLLPGIIGRPLSLVRCPDGIGKQCFFQKHSMKGMPESIRIGTQTNTKGEKEEYLYVDGIEGVMGMVQMNVIEIHPWGSTIADLEHPDRLIFDLDPDVGVAWPRVKKAATLLRERLAAVGLQSFLRTTGGKGLHVVVPLNPRPDWDSAKAFSQALARTLEQESPEDYVSVATKSKRKGHIFVDYLRNARGSTAVASYCARAREGAGIATPLHWTELSRLRSGAQYTIANLARRLKAMQDDPWRDIETVRQALPRANSNY